MISIDSYQYELPDELVAKVPCDTRDGGRMLVLGSPNRHEMVRRIADELRPGDLVVVNRTKVMPARLYGKRSTGGGVEFLFLEQKEGPIRSLIKPSKKVREGEKLTVMFDGSVVGTVCPITNLGGGEWLVNVEPSAEDVMALAGSLPIPPYMQRSASSIDGERYQTVFAKEAGAVAAPTAGLHLTESIINEVTERGIEMAEIVLHVGIGTFRTLRPEDIAAGQLHEERYHVPDETRKAVIRCRERGGRVIAVGTTVTRTLEAATKSNESVPIAGDGVTRIFLREGYEFKCVNGLLTNFHLPRTSLLMLVSAFAGRDKILSAYKEAISERYRFYSYGDAMLIL